MLHDAPIYDGLLAENKQLRAVLDTIEHKCMIGLNAAGSLPWAENYLRDLVQSILEETRRRKRGER